MKSLVYRQFQFPSNGKVYSESETVGASMQHVTSFNSLQTGKCIQSESRILKTGSLSTKRFNSLQTGKCIQRHTFQATPRLEGVKVSIPFKRESVFRVMESCVIGNYWMDTCFNSLQTGKCIQRRSKYNEPKFYNSFNSLQTGKCIQRAEYTGIPINVINPVSIPFKRESVFRVYLNLENPNEIDVVSIPFKRESVFRAKPNHGPNECSPVSIPFKRESVFRAR